MKFGISEEDELNILKDWRDNYSYSKVPKNLQKKVKDQQAVNLLMEFTKDSEIDYQRISNRIKELEDKIQKENQKEKEQSFWYILKKEFKEKAAKAIVWVVMSIIGFILGFLVSYFLK